MVWGNICPHQMIIMWVIRLHLCWFRWFVPELRFSSLPPRLCSDLPWILSKDNSVDDSAVTLQLLLLVSFYVDNNFTTSTSRRLSLHTYDLISEIKLAEKIYLCSSIVENYLNVVFTITPSWHWPSKSALQHCLLFGQVLCIYNNNL